MQSEWRIPGLKQRSTPPDTAENEQSGEIKLDQCFWYSLLINTTENSKNKTHCVHHYSMQDNIQKKGIHLRKAMKSLKIAWEVIKRYCCLRTAPLF